MKTGWLVALWRDKRRLTLLLVYGLVATGVGAAAMYVTAQAFSSSGSHAVASGGSRDLGGSESGEEQPAVGESNLVELPRQKWAIAGLRVQPVKPGLLEQNLWVTGKLTVNEDRLAHIYSLVEGLIHTVDVRFGQDVKQGDVLAVVDSKEVGSAKLNLYATGFRPILPRWTTSGIRRSAKTRSS